MKKYIFAIILLAAVSFAQSSDKVVLVSDVTSVDMFIAKAAGEKTGVPVLVLENGTMDDGTRAELISLSAKTVYLVGGPAVIGMAAETELQVKYTVVRLWGYERTGTAVAVARHFWSEGAPCAVVADDTKSSDADTEVQDEASDEAADKGCPFFPVPRGTIPAEVLDAIGDLNITNATFIGKVPNGEFRSKLAKLIIREIVGDIKKIERDIDKNATRLLIIAAPDWKYVLGHAGHEGRHTLVRIVNSTDSIPELVALVNERNLTDVRVLGKPDLAGQIAAQLNASGITVRKISGSNAAESAREALKETMNEWEDRLRDAAQHDMQMRSKAKIKLSERLTDLQDKLNSMEAELAERNASGRGSADLQAKIDAAQKQISVIKEYIDSSNYDTARIRIDKIIGEVESARWADRDAQRERDDVAEEEASVEQTQPDIEAIASKVASIKERCNSDAVGNLVEKARALKQEYDKTEDAIKSARLAVEIRSLVAQANSIGNLCDRTEKIDDDLETGAGTRVKNVEVVKARIIARPVAVAETS